MPRAYFWNAEHLSTQAETLALARQARLDRSALNTDLLNARDARRGSAASLPVTRSMVSSGGPMRTPIGGGIGKVRDHPYARPEKPVYSDDVNIQRQTEREVRRLNDVEELEYRADVSKRKCDTQDWLDGLADPVFYCEVQANFPGHTSSLRAGVMPGGATLCYYTSLAGGIADPAGFPAAGGGVPGPPAGPHLAGGGDRIPMLGVHGGANLFFWHAPSRNNGEVVAAVWNWILGAYPGGNNILFGDLNCEPGQLMAAGVPLGQIAAPVGPTRISGRTLDYALYNFGNVLTYRAFDQATPHRQIKRRFGSDHAAMCIRW